MEAHERQERAVKYLYTILRKQGPVYTLGLCIGILGRLAKLDFQIYNELKHRAEQLDEQHSQTNLRR